MALSGEGRPRLWIVAGPNGSGKSTAYGQGDVAGLDGSVWIINPDLLTVRLRDAEGLSLTAANLAAVQRIEAWLDASLEVHQTIGVETVLSSPKYRRLVDKAKAHGFQICFVFVFLRDAELRLERIKARVAKGGHDVPPDKVRDRRTRSFQQAGWFFWQADRAWLFDNSASEPELVGRKEEGEVRLSSDLTSELLASLGGGSD